MKIADSSIGYSRVPALSDQDHEIEVDKLLLSPSDVEDEELDNTNPKVWVIDYLFEGGGK